jgi:threonine synthase
MWAYAALLPVDDPGAAVTLAEGGTPLLPAGSGWGCRLWLKDETRNPTGSHKDRALSVAVTRGRELGFRSCVVISAGSTGLSTAAYAARAGMRCAVVVPAGTPGARLAPLGLYGATVLEAPGPFEVGLRLVEELGRQRPMYVTSTYRRGNPYQAEGTKTIGYELAAQLGRAPDWIVVPTGGGGTAAALWRAFGELRDLGLLPEAGGEDGGGARRPRIVTVQPSAYNALEIALRDDLRDEAALYALGLSEEVPTVQAKLQHGVPPDALYALEALRASDGLAISVTDDEALAAQRDLAREGVFGEPSAAAALAGVRRLVARGAVQPDHTVVALVTGSGFREVATSRPVTRQALTETALLDALT